MFGSYERKMMERAIMMASQHWADWQGFMNKTLRSVEDTVKWEVGQCKGEFAQTVVSVLRQFSDVSALQFLHLKVSFKRPDLKLTLDHPTVAWERTMADLFGKFATFMIAFRYARMAPLLRGWPRHAVVIQDSSCAASALNMFRQDMDNYNRLNVGNAGVQVTK